MGWIRCVGCEKWQRDIVPRTFALFAPVLSDLQQVSCSYEMIPNAPKYYETDRNISLGSNGVDCVDSLWKILSWLHGTNFCMNWTSSVCLATGFMHQFCMFCTKFHAVTKRSQMHPYTMKHTKTWVYGPMWWIRCVRCKKLQRDFMARTFVLIESLQYV